jgi:hypothetical protein
MPKSINKPPTLPPGVEFYMYVGLCITAWAKVDEELFDILVEVLGTTRELTSIIYYTITMLSGRLRLADELITSVLPKPVKKSGGHHHALVVEWTKLKKEVESLFSTRTQIAHHPVNNQITFRYRESGEIVPAGISVPIDQTTWVNSYSIYVGQSERLRGRHEQAIPITADELGMHCQKVQGVAEKLKHFRRASLGPHLESVRKVTRPALAPIRITAGLPKGHRTPHRS